MYTLKAEKKLAVIAGLVTLERSGGQIRTVPDSRVVS